MNQPIASHSPTRALHSKPRSRRQRGQALVESVLTLTAFLAIFLGMIEVGEILYHIHQTLVERTRSAGPLEKGQCLGQHEFTDPNHKYGALRYNRASRQQHTDFRLDGQQCQRQPPGTGLLRSGPDCGGRKRLLTHLFHQRSCQNVGRQHQLERAVYRAHHPAKPALRSEQRLVPLTAPHLDA